MNSNEKTDWEFPLSIPKNPVKKFLKNSIGKLALALNPRIKEELIKGTTPKNKLERAALTSIFIEYSDKKRLSELADLHRKIWISGETQGYYNITSDRMQKMFEELSDSIFTSISTQTKQANYQELVELGCGDGMVVHTLSEKFKEIPRFVGVDINKAQIDINKSTYSSNERLAFEAGDMVKDLDSIAGPNKIYLTFGGVLEYLAEQELLGFLKKLSVLENTVLLLYEPVQPGFATKEEKHSILYGSELSFSHPYHYYLSTLGFEIVNEKLINSKNRSYLFLSAKIN